MVSVDVAAIPDELKERDQWLNWDADAEKPRRPHAAGDWSASWTDPDDWLPFEEAVAAAETTGSWGVGYVFSLGNPDHPRGLYSAIDLDGCVNERGGPKDWLPALEPFNNETYMEYSPSGEGIHVPLVGIEVPEWWANAHFTEEEHEGVEFYSKKFFTFTGDALDTAAPTIADLSQEIVEEWLADVYEAITGEDPRLANLPAQDDTESRETQKSREELADIETTDDYDDVLDALDHLEPHDLSLRSSKTEDENREYESWDPGYRSSQSGKSLKRHKQSGVFFDMSNPSGQSDYDGFGVLDLFAAEQGIIRRPWDRLQGDDFKEAVRKARGTGAPIPEFVGSRDDNPDDAADEEVTGWRTVINLYEEERNKDARKIAANLLEGQTSWMYVLESERLWVYDDKKGYFNSWGESHAASELETQLGTHYTRTEKEEVIEKLKVRNKTHRERLNARTREDPLLCVGNGVTNLATGEKADHSPEYKFTRGLEWDYDPARADPEPVREFLDDVTKREEDRDTLLDHLAHGLMPGHPYRAMVIMYGPGSNGKTRVGKLLRGFVGEDNAASVELQDLTGDDSFATGGLPGAYVNVGDDISVGEIRNTSIIKSLSGDGTMRANEKFEKKFDFENEAAMFFSANEPPRIREKTAAIDDRLYPIEMPYRFVDDPTEENEKRKIPGIAESLTSDDEAMRGLLLLAVKHAQELIERNGEYSMPEGPAERREMYEAASDPIKRFALDFLEAGTGNDVVLKEDAYHAYTEMCKREGERATSEDVFKDKVGQLASLPTESTRTRTLTPGDSRDRGWRHVRFSDGSRDLLPPHVLARYFGAEEAEDVPEDADLDRAAAFDISHLAEVAPRDGYVTLELEVVNVEYRGEEGIRTGTLKDETDMVDFVDFEDCEAFDKLEVGETYRFEGVHLEESDRYGLQLKPNPDVVRVDHITRDSSAGGMNQGLNESAATDGGAEEFEQLEPKVKQQILENHDSGDAVKAAYIAGNLGESPSDVENVLEGMAEKGRSVMPHPEDPDAYKVE